MTRRRFQFQQIIERGYLIAEITDTKAGRNHFIYRKGSQYLEWNRSDAPVKNRYLKQEARRALDEAESKRAAA